MAIDPGFRTDHLLTAEITLPTPHYGDSSPLTNRFYEQVLEKISQSRGVISAATTTQVPLRPSQVMTRFLIEGAPAACTRHLPLRADPLRQPRLLPHHGHRPSQRQNLHSERHRQHHRLLHRQPGIRATLSIRARSARRQHSHRRYEPHSQQDSRRRRRRQRARPRHRLRP